MTRTQKLGLCTWLPEDPVSLAEVNDNFTRLDASGGRALQLAETGLINLGGLMAAQAHAGGHAAYAQNISVDAFRDTAQMTSYENLYHLGGCLELLTAGLSGGEVASGTATSGSTTFPASNVSRQFGTKQQWLKLFDFQPAAYGQLTKLTIKTLNTALNNTTAHIKLSLWDENSGEMLLETGLGTIMKYDGADVAVGFTVDYLIDPNRKYDMMLWIEDMPVSYLVFSTMNLTITPQIYTTGAAVMNAATVPGGATRAELLVHTGADEPQIGLRFDAGAYTTASETSSTADQLPNGTGCVLRRYTVAIPAGAQSAQLMLTLPSAGCKIYDYAMILL